MTVAFTLLLTSLATAAAFLDASALATPLASLTGCPAAPKGFNLLPSHCIGIGGSCNPHPLASGNCSPDTVAACFTAAARACSSNSRCNSFTILAAGSTCVVGDAGAPRWHIYSEGAGDADANSDWVAYVKAGLPTPAPTPSAVAVQMSCAMRKLAAITASKRIGQVFGAAGDAAIADALRLHECGLGQPAAAAESQSSLAMPAAAALTVHISPSGDDDAGDGSEARPYRSPVRARDAIRAYRTHTAADTTAAVVVHDGIYYLGSMAFRGPLQLDDQDSSTSWRAAQDASPFFSGAVNLASLHWAPTHDDTNNSATSSILVADVSKIVPFSPQHEPKASSSLSFASAFDSVTGARLIRARTPNGNPETTEGLCVLGGHAPSEGCAAFLEGAKNVGQHVAATSKTVRFNTTRGGAVAGDDIYREYHVIYQQPPSAYPPQFQPVVCNQGEGGGELYNRSSGIQYSSSSKELANASAWSARGEGAVVHMMHNGWGNVQFVVDSVNATTRVIKFKFGGFQHGRSGGASSYWIENVKELLDSPGEWYLDEAAQRMYIWPNTTTDTDNTTDSNNIKSNSSAGPVIAMSGAVLQSVVIVNGSRTAPVHDVSFHGIGFGHTAPTFLEPHERPISGDWAIHRGGTVHVTGAVNISFSQCRWNRTGGNGLIWSRWVKNSSVIESEFVSLGDSAIVAYGDANWTTGVAHGALSPGYPSGITIERNLMHEIGVWGKQTSCFFQGVSGRNTFRDNVCFNGPRALVNINDGLLGLSLIEGNVLFNGCRESDDHGNFNSWDRTPLLHLEHDSWGPESWSPGTSIIRRNLIQNSYGAGHGIDHDDGSNFWQDVENVVCFSHACKGNFGSNRNCSHNLVIAPGLKDAYGTTAKPGAPCAEETNNGHGSSFANKYFEHNTCAFIAEGTNEAYVFEGCRTGNSSGAAMDGKVWQTRANTYLVPKGSSVVANCGGHKVPLAEWQTKYRQDVGATVHELPSTDELVQMAAELLG